MSPTTPTDDPTDDGSLALSDTTDDLPPGVVDSYLDPGERASLRANLSLVRKQHGPGIYQHPDYYRLTIGSTDCLLSRAELTAIARLADVVSPAPSLWDESRAPVGDNSVNETGGESHE